MSKIMEERIAEARKIEAYQVALRILKGGNLTFEETAEVCGLTLEEVKELAKENNIVTV